MESHSINTLINNNKIHLLLCIFLSLNIFFIFSISSSVYEPQDHAEIQNEHDELSNRISLSTLRRGIFCDRYNDSDTLYKVVRGGALRGISDVTATSVKGLFRFVIDIIKAAPSSAFNAVYKVSYGQNSLTPYKLSLMNKRVQDSVGHFTQISLGNFTKQKRALLIESDDNNAEDNIMLDQDWIMMQSSIIEEINDVIFDLKRSLPCYSFKHYKMHRNPSFVKSNGAKLLNKFSSLNNSIITRYVLKNIKYLTQVKEFFKNAKSYQEVQQNHESLKRWLDLVYKTFDHISQLINPYQKVERFEKSQSNRRGGYDQLIGNMLQNNNLGGL